MQVKIEKSFQVAEPIEKVWSLLSDPARVVSSVPGAKLTEVVDQNNYKGSISIKVGPAVTDYKGDVKILNQDAAGHRIELEGKGQDVKGRGSASMKMTGELRVLPGGITEVVTTSEVSVVGILAQFGGRMIKDVSAKMFEEFTKSFQRQLQEMPPPEETVSEDRPPSNDSGSCEPQRLPNGPQPSRQAAGGADPQPIEALPLLFSAIRSAFVRLIRRLFARKPES
ncbi:MAG TPA: SRPBCC family protein [Blastocatellia bacterium]|nr:SRPBCC family protein [Blastocatellia bacterium]